MGTATVIRGASVALPEGVLPREVRFDGTRVSAVDVRVPDDGAAVVDGRGGVLAPGFVDAHVHGAAGASFESGRAEEVARISRALARHGTTTILATLAALPPEPLAAAVRAIARAAPQADGARIAGIHLEGPFLNPRCCGAQDASSMRPPSVEEIDRLQDLAEGRVRLVTVAPELPGALRFVEEMRRREIRVALGHSDADESLARAAVDAGATHVVHLYNAMSPFHHRRPGLLGAALCDDRLSVELVCDGHHVAPGAVDVVLRCKPKHRTLLVSDAVAALDLPDGDVDLFGAACEIRDGAVRRRDGGALAGSCLTLDRAIRNLRGWFPELSAARALEMATLDPARSIGEEHASGAIRLGRGADLVLLDRQWNVTAVWHGGELLWRAASDAAGSSRNSNIRQNST